MKNKKICSVCNGNGFVRVPYKQAGEEIWADCDFCKNLGEVPWTEEDKEDEEYKDHLEKFYKGKLQ